MALKIKTAGLKQLCRTHDVTVHAATDVRGAAGAKATTGRYATTGTAKTCFVQPARSTEQMVALQKGYEISHVLYFAESPGCGNGDGIKYGSKWLIVQGDPIDTDGQGVLYKVLALETEFRQQEAP